MLLGKLGSILVSRLQKLSSQMIGTTAQKRPHHGNCARKHELKVPLQQRHTVVRSAMEVATNTENFSASDHLVQALHLFQIYFLDVLRTDTSGVLPYTNSHKFS